MGTVGALVLAVLRDPNVGKSSRVFWFGIAAAGIAAIIGIYAFKSLPFQVAISVFYVTVVWMLVRSAQIPGLRALIKRAFETTMRLTAMVIFILIGSMCFSTVFQGVNGGPWLEHLMTSIPGGVWGFLIAVNLFIFFIAFFLDFFEIVFILVPLLAPIAKTLLTPIVGPDAALIWFGVMLCVNLQTSFMHPPFGFALFYLRGVAPKEVKSSDIYWGAIPFVILQLVLVAMVVAFPKQVTMFLDKPIDVDLDKVKIELQQEPADAGKAATEEDDIMKSFGGKK
jgi:TRAP-type C4-dicarboxylate transport system permease large subunit